MITNSSNNNNNNATTDKLSIPPKTSTMRLGLYDILDTIGHGNYSQCKLAKHVITNERVVIKCIDKKKLDNSNSSRIYREMNIMKSLDHQNIIKLNQVMESESMIYLVCDYAVNGDVFDYISRNGAMNEKMACKKFCQILSALEYCHQRNIVHRDLKSENLLLDANMNIKLADFGFSNFYDLINPLNTFCGSPPYAAPEIFSGKKYYGPEVDIWSLGVILYVLISATLPFDSDNLQHIKQRVSSGKYRIPYYISQECEHLINHILVVNTSKRFKLQQIKSHKWIKSNNTSFYNNSKKPGDKFAKMQQSFENQSDVTCEDPFLKVEREKFQSKSLKLTGNKRAKHAEDQKKKIALSSLSLPLYSVEDCFTGSNDSILTDLQDTLSSEQCLVDNFSETNKNLENNKSLVNAGEIKSMLMDFENLNLDSAKNDWAPIEQQPAAKAADQLCPVNSLMLKDLAWNSTSLDESVDSGLSTTPLTSSLFSFCSNSLSINSQKFRLSQNSLDHYSNHPSTHTRKAKLSTYPHRKNRISLFKKAFKSHHSTASKSTYDQSLQELNSLMLNINKMKHSVCENALNEAALDSKRKTFKTKESNTSKSNPESLRCIVENPNAQSNSLQKCKKLFLSMGQKSKNK